MKWYLVTYGSGRKRGCPLYLKGKLSRRKEWDKSDPDPFHYEISNDYVFSADHALINFDFWDGGPLVSGGFVSVCEEFGVKFRLVPIRVVQSGGDETEKSYFYMLFVGRYSIFDHDASELKYDADLKAGEVLYEKYYPNIPYVISISKAVIDESKILGVHLFRCLELSDQIVCSAGFKARCEELGLRGLLFTEIDDDFRKQGPGEWEYPVK